MPRNDSRLIEAITRKQRVDHWGSAPDPGICRFGANLGERAGRQLPPQSPILAPETALRLFPNRALSSVQAKPIVTHQIAAHKKETQTPYDSVKVVRSESLAVLDTARRFEIPPVWANSNEPVDADLIASDPCPHVALNGVALTARNSH